MRCHHSLDIRGTPRTTKLHWSGRRGLRCVYCGRRSSRLHRPGSPSAQCHGTLQFTGTLRRTTGETPDPKGPQHIREHRRGVAKLPHRATAAPRIRADQRLTKFIKKSGAKTARSLLLLHYHPHTSLHIFIFSPSSSLSELFSIRLWPAFAYREKRNRHQEYLALDGSERSSSFPSARTKWRTVHRKASWNCMHGIGVYLNSRTHILRRC